MGKIKKSFANHYWPFPWTHLLNFVPWHRGRGCLCAAPVTRAAADEYIRDCNDTPSVTVARRLKPEPQFVGGGLGGCCCLFLQYL